MEAFGIDDKKMNFEIFGDCQLNIDKQTQKKSPQRLKHQIELGLLIRAIGRPSR